LWVLIPVQFSRFWTCKQYCWQLCCHIHVH